MSSRKILPGGVDWVRRYPVHVPPPLLPRRNDFCDAMAMPLGIIRRRWFLPDECILCRRHDLLARLLLPPWKPLEEWLAVPRWLILPRWYCAAIRLQRPRLLLRRKRVLPQRVHLRGGEIRSGGGVDEQQLQWPVQ